MEKALKYFIEYDEEFKKSDQQGPPDLLHIGYAFWANGFKEKAEYYFNKALERNIAMIELGRPFADLTPFSLAAFYAFSGDKDKAFENLRLINQKQRMPLYLIKEFRYNPLFDNIRDESEFQQIVRDVEAKYQAEHERVKKWLEENDML
jgi:hypothetical protein